MQKVWKGDRLRCYEHAENYRTHESDQKLKIEYIIAELWSRLIGVVILMPHDQSCGTLFFRYGMIAVMRLLFCLTFQWFCTSGKDKDENQLERQYRPVSLTFFFHARHYQMIEKIGDTA